MKTYAIAHAFRGISYVSELRSNEKLTPKVKQLKTPQAKEEFLDAIKPGDLLLLENNGNSYPLALNALLGKAEVLLIPGFKISDSDRVRKEITAKGWKIKEEAAFGDETGTELTARKVRAHAMLARYLKLPGQFTEQREMDLELLLLKQEYRSFMLMQKTLLAGYFRLLSLYNDRYILEHAKHCAEVGTKESLAQDKISTQAILKVVDALLTDIPERGRKAFKASLGLGELKKKKLVPKKTVKKTLQEIVHALLKKGSMQGIVAAMAQLKWSIEKRLKRLDIYRKVFKPIPGCGPLIAARIMTTIVDIRRFSSFPALKAYAAYHHLKDGSRARRRRGKAYNCNTELKQAVWQFTQQAIKLPGTYWRQRLDQRCAYELFKILANIQREVSSRGWTLTTLPNELQGRTITCVNDVSVEDLAFLKMRVDKLRILSISAPAASDDCKLNVAGRERLGRLVKGIKGRALNKAFRWLGQQFLKHVFKEWRKAVGLSEYPTKFDPDAPVFLDGSPAKPLRAPKPPASHRRPPIAAQRPDASADRMP